MAYYFAYGSCMSTRDLSRTTKAEFISAGTLFDYKLAFTRYSVGRKGGVADVVESAGDFVEGVIFKVKDLKALDRREGHPFAYKRVPIKVYDHDHRKFRKVWTYVVTNKEPYEIRPSRKYADLIREGARQFLSLSYREDLEANLKQFRAPYDIEQDIPFLDVDTEWEFFKNSLKERMGNGEEISIQARGL